MTDFYFGSQGPNSGTTPETALDFVVTRLLNRRVHVEVVQIVAVTNSPGSIQGVGTVNVQPLVNQVDGYGNAIPHGIVTNLRYFRYAGGGNAIIIDPQVGDIGVAVMADRDPSVVFSTQAQANPASGGRSRFEFGIYIGLCVGNANPNQYITFTENGINIVTGGSISIKAPAGIEISGNVTTKNNLSAGNGISCSFTTSTGQLVTVQNGIVTNIV